MPGLLRMNIDYRMLKCNIVLSVIEIYALIMCSRPKLFVLLFIMTQKVSYLLDILNKRCPVSSVHVLQLRTEDQTKMVNYCFINSASA